MCRRTRLLSGAALALAAVLTLPVGPAPLASAASITAPLPVPPSPAEECPAGTFLAEGRGLDGGLGCASDTEVDGPSAKLSARPAADVARAGGSGEDRLVAFEQAQAAVAAAEQRREQAGTTDFVAVGGAEVPNSSNAWRNIGPQPLVFDDPEFPRGNAGLGKAAGRVSALAVDTRDPSGDTLYVGPAAGGVYRSTDGGQSFTPVGDALPSLAIGAMAVSPDTGWVYVGTGEESTGTDNYAGVGLFRSKDNGQTWERNTQVPADTVISQVTVSGDRVFVATSQGLWRSTDRGDTFANANLPTNAAGDGVGTRFLQNYVTDVRVRPGLPDQVVAAVGWRSGGGASNRLDGKGLYRSTDGGATWTRNNGLGFGVNSTSDDPIGRISLAYATGPGQDNNILWAVVQDAGRLNNDQTPLDFPGEPAQPARVPFTVLNGIYRSGDNGATWQLKGSYENLVVAPGSSYTPTFTPSQAGPGVQSWYNQWIEVDPGNADRVLVGLEEVFQTVGPATNAPTGPAQFTVVGRYGNTCTPLNVQCPVFTGKTVHPDQHDGTMVQLPNGQTRAYIANDGGTYRQDRTTAPTDNFASDAWFNTADSFSTNQFHAAIMGGDGVVYGGMQDNGTVRVEPRQRGDKPAGYAVEILGGDGFDVMVEPQDSEKMYAETQNGNINKSGNGGRSFTAIVPSGSTRPQFFTPFEMDPTDKNHLIYGSGQIYQSTVGQATTSANWARVFTLDAPNSVSTLDVQGDAVYAVFCGECNATPNAGNGGEYDPAIYTGGIATNVGRPGCTPTKGMVGDAGCWHVAAANGLPDRFIGGIDIDPVDPETVYAAVSSYRRRWLYREDARETPNSGILYKSTDGGENFTDISGDLPETFGADVVVQGGRLIVATDTGVYANASTSSTSFVPFGVGIPLAVPAYDLSLNPQQDTLLLATHGRGLYTLDLAFDAPPGVIPEVPLPALLPLGAALLAAGVVFWRRRQGLVPAGG